MSTILFKENKQLVLTKNTKIRQGESRVDVLELLVPLTINDLAMDGFIATLLYVDAANVSHMENLTLSGDTEDGLYKDSWYRYVLPVDSKFTYMAGDVKMEVTLTKYDASTDTSYVMHSSELTVTILTWEDYYRFMPDASLNAIDERLLEMSEMIASMNASAETLEKQKAVDLMLTEDLLQLKDNEGNPMGSGIEILTGVEDTDDNPDGAIIDIGSQTESDKNNRTLIGLLDL